MNTTSVVDIAKSVFHVCVWMDGGSVAWSKKISHSRLQDTVRQFGPETLIAMAVCPTSYFAQCYGIPREAEPCTTCEKLCPKPEKRCQQYSGNLCCETALCRGIHFASVKIIQPALPGNGGDHPPIMMATNDWHQPPVASPHRNDGTANGAPNTQHRDTRKASTRYPSHIRPHAETLP